MELTFWFDYVSPYAYLAAAWIETLAKRHGLIAVPIPVLFGGMLEATGNKGPAETAAKRRYTYLDVDRIAHQLGVPLEPPATHPFNPLVALRMTTAVVPEKRWPLVHALYRAAWVDSLRLDQPEVARDVATAAGFDGTALLELSGAPEVKARLRQATDDALAAGAFGVPTMLVRGELYWGIDSFPRLQSFLGGTARSAAELAARAERWERVEPSAVRKS